MEMEGVSTKKGVQGGEGAKRREEEAVEPRGGM